MPTVCSNCGGTDIEHDHARGDSVCTNCGSVLEDNIIVSEVSFQEQSSGASSVVGQFVSSEGGSFRSGSSLPGSSLHHGLGKDSREVTLQQARRRLNVLGSMLKLGQYCIDTAFNFFKLALQQNLTRGRKSSVIDTACLYLVCRSEGTPHLLLDFSDVLQINVYALGRAYLKLADKLHINPPAIDPCLYIHRFAHKLELGKATHEVSMTAMRLVARMKRDWIHHGRRPAGLCGAALLVAARMHNFNRTVKDVAKVVRLSEGTIRKRLGDFKDTPSSRLTIEEFLKIDLDQEHDPPCFLESKRKKLKQDGSGDSEVLPSAELPVKDVGVESSTTSTKEGEEAEEEGGRGFGGIQMRSVRDIIAKARADEDFFSATTMAGLSNRIEDLVKLVDGENNEDDAPPTEGELLDLTGIDDTEISDMILSEEESRIKSKLWFAENGDFLKQQEERRQAQAALKDQGEKPKKRKPRKPKVQYNTPANSAGEAIERMLVEKKISSKINYDILKDLDRISNSDSGSTSQGPSKDQSFSVGLNSPQPQPSLLTVDRTSSLVNGRLPSLTSRKRSLSSLGPEFSLTTQRPSQLGRAMPLSTEQVREEVIDESECVAPPKETDATPAEGDVLVVESGPVLYSDEEGEGLNEDANEEGLNDDEMKELAYEGDPLLHSDYEDEGGDEW